MLAGLPALFAGFWSPKYWAEYIPWLYGPVPIVDMGASAVGTHLAGTMVFVLIGYPQGVVAWVCVWFATLALVCATNRGATLAVVLPVVVRDAHARTVSLDADHGGGGLGHTSPFSSRLRPLSENTAKPRN